MIADCKTSKVTGGGLIQTFHLTESNESKICRVTHCRTLTLR